MPEDAQEREAFGDDLEAIALSVVLNEHLADGSEALKDALALLPYDALSCLRELLTRELARRLLRGEGR